MTINTDSVLDELRRELAMRQRVYPNWVRAGNLSQQTSDFRIQAIEQAIKLIEAMQPQQGGLFDE
jgi:hypothetical protein